MIDLAILNATVVTEHGERALDVGIEGERIVAVAPRGELPAARRTIDATGMLLLPGAVDVHFHCRTPGYENRGDFFTETCAAAAGGTTSIFEMPISQPGCATVEIFRDRRRLIEEQAVIDVALYGAPGTLNRDDVLGMAAEGAIGYKIFMHRAPAGREEEFIGICLTEDDELFQAMSLTRETGLRLVAHCESDSMLEAGLARERERGDNSLSAHGASRPPVVEAVAVARFLTMAEATGAPVHVAHVSCKQALDVLKRFQRDGVDATGETCPHYLFFTAAQVRKHAGYAKINPPVRGRSDQDALWEGLKDGSLCLVTTDHAPYIVDEKERGAESIWKAPAGAPGAQTLLPLMLDAALRGRLTLAQAVALISSQPARLFGLYPRKGAIVEGADADICLFDPRPTITFSRDRMVSKAADVDKLYEGLELRGEVVATISHGRVIYEKGAILAEPGSGRFLRP